MMVASEELDKYMLSLKYIYLEDGTFYNDKMIRDGYTMNILILSHINIKSNLKKQKEASAQLRGLWAPDTAMVTLLRDS